MSQIVAFLGLAEKLKDEIRHSWTSSGRPESVAEHSWRMSLMAMLVAKRVDRALDELKLLKLVIVHDIVEAVCGDVPVFDVLDDAERRRAKQAREREAIATIRAMLPADVGDEIESLWEEFEVADTYEAKVAVALDKLEAQLQHNEADISTWKEIEFGLTFRLGKYTAFDTYLDALRRDIEDAGAQKISAAGFDVTRYRSEPSAPGG
ncbi:HD domain-containing protein [Pararobbsia silviterrae]|uniref:HD domain-containing protein n=2 Tax=Pararobbsia silviterrae TaxID=1792498 RepID=A0A494XG80_9BURK|nr:HD domain-containing protein [Pararobbsia silviterrae]